MKNALKIILISFPILLLSIHSATTEKGGISGRWSKYPGSVWVLYTNNTYSLSIGYGIHMIGTYSTDGNKLILSEQKGSFLALLCRGSSQKVQTKGGYEFQLEGSNLVVVQYNESCEQKKGEVPGTYRRL